MKTVHAEVLSQPMNIFGSQRLSKYSSSLLSIVQNLLICMCKANQTTLCSSYFCTVGKQWRPQAYIAPPDPVLSAHRAGGERAALCSLAILHALLSVAARGEILLLLCQAADFHCQHVRAQNVSLVQHVSLVQQGPLLGGQGLRLWLHLTSSGSFLKCLRFLSRTSPEMSFFK